MRHLLILTLLCFLVQTAWSQIHIDSLRLTLLNIPVNERITDNDTNEQLITHSSWYFIGGKSHYWDITVDSLTVNCKFYSHVEDISFSSTKSYQVAFNIDTFFNILSQFSLKYSDNVNSYQVRDWTQERLIKFNPVRIARYGNGYRAYFSRNELIDKNFVFSDAQYSVYSSGNKSSYTLSSSLETGVLDTSSVELMLYGMVPLGVTPQKSDIRCQLFPNPVINSILYISSDKYSDLLIWDIFGRQVAPLSLSFADNLAVLDVSNLSVGIYWLKVGTFLTKFTKL